MKHIFKFGDKVRFQNFVKERKAIFIRYRPYKNKNYEKNWGERCIVMFKLGRDEIKYRPHNHFSTYTIEVKRLKKGW